MDMKKYITDILSNTTEINDCTSTIKTFCDDKGKEFLSIFYNEDMLVEYAEIYTPEKTVVIHGEEIQELQELLDMILERQKEL